MLAMLRTVQKRNTEQVSNLNLDQDCLKSWSLILVKLVVTNIC